MHCFACWIVLLSLAWKVLHGLHGVGGGFLWGLKRVPVFAIPRIQCRAFNALWETTIYRNLHTINYQLRHGRCFDCQLLSRRGWMPCEMSSEVFYPFSGLLLYSVLLCANACKCIWIWHPEGLNCPTKFFIPSTARSVLVLPQPRGLSNL